jgi:Domain of Unknown Function (DUF928)
MQKVLHMNSRHRLNSIVVFHRSLCAVALVVGLVAAPARAETSGNSGESDTIQGGEVAFIPPKDGSPEDRVGAGTRNFSAESGALTLLVPRGGGETSKASPLFVWYLAQDTEGRVRFELEVKGRLQKIYEKSRKWKAGLYGLSLRPFWVTLKPGRPLRWSVTVIPATAALPTVRAESLIERVSSDRVPPQFEDPHDAMRALAAAGLWFDALEKGVALSSSGEVRVRSGDDLRGLLGTAGLKVIPFPE